MNIRSKWIPFLVTAVTLVGLFIISGYSPIVSAPLLQLTPAVDPMSTATVEAPALDTQNGLPGNMTGADAYDSQMNCPMMSGSMGTGSMSGMSGIGPMGSMSGSMADSMSGSMPMGAMGFNDDLSNTQRGLFSTTNPWWLVGWIVVFIILIGILVFLVLGIIWMVGRMRGEKTAVSG